MIGIAGLELDSLRYGREPRYIQRVLDILGGPIALEHGLSVLDVVYATLVVLLLGHHVDRMVLGLFDQARVDRVLLLLLISVCIQRVLAVVEARTQDVEKVAELHFNCVCLRHVESIESKIIKNLIFIHFATKTQKKCFLS
jgi:hypothetical protein